MNNYAFLESHENFHHQTVAGDVMYPQSGDSPLVVLKQDSMTIREIEDVLANSAHNGYPVTSGNDNTYVMGFVTRKELKIAIGNTKSLFKKRIYSCATLCAPVPSTSETFPWVDSLSKWSLV